MNKKIFRCVVLVVLLILPILSLTPVRAEVQGEQDPTVEVIDFNNGTTLTIIDYHNGTIVEGRRTYYPGKGSLKPLEGSENQSFLLDVPVVGGDQCINDPSIPQDILLGFTWSYDIFPTWSYEWEMKFLGITIGSAKLEIGVGVGIGLRLPIRITLDYFETMLSNTDYTVNATLETIDWADLDELFLSFHCGAHLSANVIGLKDDWTLGIWYDGSKSFETPLGDVPIPLPPIPIEIANLGIKWLGGITVDVNIVPKFYCNRIEATADVIGNASIVGSSAMSWSTSGEKISLNIHTNDVDESGSALISMSDFKYIIDELLLDFDFVIDPYGLLDWIDNFEITLLTWDVSGFLPDLVLGVHSGHPESVGVNTFIERVRDPSLHDLAITNVTTSTHDVYQGELIQIFVTAENKGNVTETFTVIAYYDNQSIGTRIVEDLTPKENVFLTFNWNTEDVAQGYWYSIKAEASIIAGEIDIINNLYIDGAVKVRCVGDLNDDGIINMRDISLASIAFGSYPGHPRWNPVADANQDNKVDMRDLATVASNFGKTT